MAKSFNSNKINYYFVALLVLFMDLLSYSIAGGIDTLIGSVTGEMNKARIQHTATLLPNGKVLIVGGHGTFNYKDRTDERLSSAELYDPQMGTFSPTGSMEHVCGYNTATRLPNGKVLVVGGKHAELYDWETGLFSPVGTMEYIRWEGFTATLLGNGKVLVIGGARNNETIDKVSVSAELYDPVSNSFSPTGSTNHFRNKHTATLLDNGKVLVVGGMAGDHAELYDPITGQFALTKGTMTSIMIVQKAILLKTGKVLLSVENPNFQELYDPVTETFSRTGNHGRSGRDFTATLLLDGKVLFAGGYLDTGLNRIEIADIMIYDPAAGKSVLAGKMSRSRLMHTATQLLDGKILFAGGGPAGRFRSAYSTAELYAVPTIKPHELSYVTSGPDHAISTNQNGAKELAIGRRTESPLPTPSGQPHEQSPVTSSSDNAFPANPNGTKELAGNRRAEPPLRASSGGEGRPAIREYVPSQSLNSVKKADTRIDPFDELILTKKIMRADSFYLDAWETEAINKYGKFNPTIVNDISKYRNKTNWKIDYESNNIYVILDGRFEFPTDMCPDNKKVYIVPWNARTPYGDKGDSTIYYLKDAKCEGSGWPCALISKNSSLYKQDKLVFDLISKGYINKSTDDDFRQWFEAWVNNNKSKNIDDRLKSRNISTNSIKDILRLSSRKIYKTCDNIGEIPEGLNIDLLIYKRHITSRTKRGQNTFYYIETGECEGRNCPK
ncbi:MAG TPA: kelch repeat-containing protein [Candidatus Deferrimicrobiaceae bacterium]|jgi:hypothetical protein